VGVPILRRLEHGRMRMTVAHHGLLPLVHHHHHHHDCVLFLDHAHDHSGHFEDHLLHSCSSLKIT
jgi:hypothetical protein